MLSFSTSDLQFAIPKIKDGPVWNTNTDILLCEGDKEKQCCHNWFLRFSAKKNQSGSLELQSVEEQQM